MYTMVKLRLNALIGIFLLLADEGHTITCVLIFRPFNGEAILKKSENGIGWPKFLISRHSKKLQVWWPLDGALLAYFAHICC